MILIKDIERKMSGLLEIEVVAPQGFEFTFGNKTFNVRETDEGIQVRMVDGPVAETIIVSPRAANAIVIY